MNRKQNSMKAYILRDPQAVEPQKARLAEAPDPSTAEKAEARLAAPRGPALYVGLGRAYGVHRLESGGVRFHRGAPLRADRGHPRRRVAPGQETSGGASGPAAEALQVNPSPGMPLWSGTQYRQLVERHAGADAIVSFVGPPLFTEAEISQLPAKLPRGLVFGGGSPGQPLRRLFERGVTQVAVVPRLTPPVSGSAPPTGPEQFAQQFQAVRTDTAGALRY